MRSIVDIKDECCSLVLVVIVDAERLVEERNDCLCADESNLLTDERVRPTGDKRGKTHVLGRDGDYPGSMDVVRSIEHISGSLPKLWRHTQQLDNCGH